jgi:hypothetical protein
MHGSWDQHPDAITLPAGPNTLSDSGKHKAPREGGTTSAASSRHMLRTRSHQSPDVNVVVAAAAAFSADQPEGTMRHQLQLAALWRFVNEVCGVVGGRAIISRAQVNTSGAPDSDCAGRQRSTLGKRNRKISVSVPGPRRSRNLDGRHRARCRCAVGRADPEPGPRASSALAEIRVSSSRCCESVTRGSDHRPGGLVPASAHVWSRSCPHGVRSEKGAR